MKITHLFKEDLLIKDYGQFFKDKKNKVFDVRLVSFKFSEKKDKDICVYDVWFYCIQLKKIVKWKLYNTTKFENLTKLKAYDDLNGYLKLSFYPSTK